MKYEYKGHSNPDQDLRNPLRLSADEKSALLKKAAKEFAVGKMTEGAFKLRVRALVNFTAADHKHAAFEAAFNNATPEAQERAAKGAK
jgi:hypothetical protein